MEKTYCIKAISMMNYLIRCGHDCIKVCDNVFDNSKKVFMFIDTPELRKDMESFKNNK